MRGLSTQVGHRRRVGLDASRPTGPRRRTDILPGTINLSATSGQGFSNPPPPAPVHTYGIKPEEVGFTPPSHAAQAAGEHAFNTETPDLPPLPTASAAPPAAPRPSRRPASLPLSPLPALLNPTAPATPLGGPAASPFQEELEKIGGTLAHPLSALGALGQQPAAAKPATPTVDPKQLDNTITSLAEHRIGKLSDKVDSGQQVNPDVFQHLAAIMSNPSTAPAGLRQRAAAQLLGQRPAAAQDPGRTPPTHVSVNDLYQQAGYAHKGGVWSGGGPNTAADRKFQQLANQATTNMTPQQRSEFLAGKRQAPAPGSKWGPTPAQANRRDPLGAKTLGDVSAQQLAHAQQAGTLKVSKKGILSTGKGRGILSTLLAAHQNVLATNGLTGPLTPSQKKIAQLVSQDLGGVLSPRTIGVQELQEQSGQHAIDREQEGNFNTLDIGYFDSGPGQLTQGSEWSNPEAAAKATAEFFEGKRYSPGAGIPDILDEAKGKSVDEQLQIIGNSGWATSDYANQLADTSALVGEKRNPEAVANLQQAKQAATAAGINPTPWQGDVAGGGGDFTIVRADAKGMLDWAESAVGTQEGTPRAEKWGARFGLNTVSQPWCANWVSNGLIRRGFGEGALPPNPNYVPSYEEWAEEGKHAHVVQGGLAAAKPGDLLAFEGEHIGVYKGGGEMISGNSGDQVQVTGAEDGGLGVMVIRPNYKGGKVKVPDAQIEGTGTTESTATGGSSEAAAGSSGTEGLEGARPAGTSEQGAREALQPTFTLPSTPGFAASVVNPEDVNDGGKANELLQLLLEPSRSTTRRR